jgi:hypothetical protein
MEEIVYRYVAEANPSGAFLPGVPQRDLTQADVDTVPAWLRPSLDTCGFYERVSPQRKVKEK